MTHGTEAYYRRHIRDGIPFPEDTGGISCGCRMAHRLNNDKRNRHGYATCTICAGRCVRRPDGICGQCRRTAKFAPREHESDEALTGGEWFNDHGVMRWRAAAS